MTWIVPTGLTVASQSHTNTVATAWLSGGTDGTRYNVVSRITTAAGRTEDRTIEIRVQEK